MTAQVMTPVPMIEPSSWLRAGITVEKVEGVNLIKFTDELHTRLEELLEKRKAQLLTAAEEAEYAGIVTCANIVILQNSPVQIYLQSIICFPDPWAVPMPLITWLWLVAVAMSAAIILPLELILRLEKKLLYLILVCSCGTITLFG